MEFNDHETDYYDLELQSKQNHVAKRRQFSQPRHSIEFVYQVKHRYANISDNNDVTLVHQLQRSDRNRRATLGFDLRVLGNPDFANAVFSPKLSSLLIDSRVHLDIVKHITDCVRNIITNSLSDNDRAVVSVTAKITRTCTMFRCERCLMFRALSESMEEEGLMVPATELSIEKMLKKVRVVVVCADEEDDDDEKKEKYLVREEETCMVCLEEYGAGSCASRMPCSHVFHDECIITWLRQSHYCPLCRFEMPTQKI